MKNFVKGKENLNAEFVVNKGITGLLLQVKTNTQ